MISIEYFDGVTWQVAEIDGASIWAVTTVDKMRWNPELERVGVRVIVWAYDKESNESHTYPIKLTLDQLAVKCGVPENFWSK